MPDRRAARPLLAVAAAGLVAAVGAGVVFAPTTACTTHDCDSTKGPPFNGADGGLGVLERSGDGNVVGWESVDFATGRWLHFPGNMTFTVSYPLHFIATGDPVVYVSTDEAQAAGGTSTPASGQLAELTNLSATGFTLQNASCADYFVQFSVPGYLSAPDASSDAGSESGTQSPLDAGPDGPHD